MNNLIDKLMQEIKSDAKIESHQMMNEKNTRTDHPKIQVFPDDPDFFPKRWSDRFRMTENNEICSFNYFLIQIEQINAESIDFQQKLCL